MKKLYKDLAIGELFGVFGDKFINHNYLCWCLCEKKNNNVAFLRIDDSGYFPEKQGMLFGMNLLDEIKTYKSVEKFLEEDDLYDKLKLLIRENPNLSYKL